MADTQRDDDADNNGYAMEDFDLVLMTSCDLHGVARGRFVFRSSVRSFVKNGVGMTPAAMFLGMKCDIPVNLTEYLEAGWANGALMPDTSTIKPLSWMSCNGRKVGHVLCDLNDVMGLREESGPRELALRKLDALKTLGYDLVMSADFEATLFYKDTVTPVGLHEDTSQLLNKLVMSLRNSGISVTSVSRGLEDGKLQISLGRQRGIGTADNLHRLRNAVRSICAYEGYDVTYMTKPLSDVSGNGSCYCYTLLARNQRNVFSDENNENILSAVGRHWLAGSLRHHAAMTALVRPTLNCYDKDDLGKLQAVWENNNTKRTSRLRVCVTAVGLSIVDSLPSSASNPYIVLGALIGAGCEGVIRKMELPDQVSKTSDVTLDTPPTLTQALVSLEKDDVFKSVIGLRFAERYRLLKREYETLRHDDNQKRDNPESQQQLERSLYLKML